MMRHARRALLAGAYLLGVLAFFEGAARLAALAESLTDAEWKTPMPGDGRSLGVIVHHVARWLIAES